MGLLFDAAMAWDKLRSRDWSRISGRLTAIINLETTLDNEFDIASFDYKKAVGYCKIKADYIIRDRISDDIQASKV